MIIIIVGMAVFFTLAIGIAILAVAGQDGAKKDAKAMLEGGVIDKAKIKSTLQVLSMTQDGEAKRLYSKLADLVDQK